MDVTFLVSTPDDEGRSKNTLSLINTRIAQWSWRVRALKTSIQNHRSNDVTPRSNITFVSEDPGNLDAKSHQQKAKCRWNTSNNSRTYLTLKQKRCTENDIPKSISTILDPFVQLPTEISRQESQILQFYLTSCRTFLYGTRSEPAYCPGLYTARRFLKYSHVHLYSVLCIAESVMNDLKGTETSERFYSFRAKAYESMNSLLDDGSTSLCQRLIGFMQLTTLEFFLKCPNVLDIHVRAMDRYIEQNGGLSHILASKVCKEPTLSMSFYVAHSFYGKLPIPNIQDLRALLKRFGRCLQRVRLWTLNLRTTLSARTTQRSGLSDTYPLSELATTSILRTYLDSVSTCMANNNTEYAKISGAFHFVFSLCMGQVVYACDAVQSLSFLENVSKCIEDSTQIQPNECTKHRNPVAANFLLGHVRCSTSPGQEANEIELCQANYDMVKLLPLLSWSTRIKLSTAFHRCATIVLHGDTTVAENLSDQVYRDLCTEIRANWMVKQAEGTNVKG